MHNLTLATLRGGITGKVVFQRWWGRQAASIPERYLRAPRDVLIWSGVYRTCLQDHGSQPLLPGPVSQFLRRDLDRRLSDGRAVVVGLPVVCASMAASALVGIVSPHCTEEAGDGGRRRYP
jgi:hypothetical protein